ncbi:unnamed protein product [Rotaria sordida]|uniref:Heat shock protein 70 n=1 Tax=Rotaria sordida TaxID=392033 RepID=A0A813RKT3_9BILA|nr:unnamed protein product [Rotaria sordida]CAF1608330.1 unnamed protein product [Rotaria sordida]
MIRKVIGIDLGTAYSCVAVFHYGKVQIIPNEQCNGITPSYVAFTDTGRLIGDPAKNQAARNPDNTIFDMNVSVPLPHSKYPALSLSPVTIDDASDMVVILNDEETVKYLIGPPYPISIEQIKDYISSRPSVNGLCLAWAIRYNGRLIGEIKFPNRKWY